MTDYMQKAREMSCDEEGELSAFQALGNLATTLESLDTERTRAEEAEQRERELRSVAQALARADIISTTTDDEDRVIVLTYADDETGLAAFETLMEAHALIQPEPDPLVEAVKEVAFHDTAGFSSIEEYAERLRTALAKHGLSIVKGES